MALALNPNGSGIPGLDAPPRKASRILAVGLAVSVAAHLGLIGYLAYQKWIEPLPTMVDDKPIVVDTVPLERKPPPPPPPIDKPPPPTAGPKLHAPILTTVDTPPGPSPPVRTIATRRSVLPAPEMNCFWPFST